MFLKLDVMLGLSLLMLFISLIIPIVLFKMVISKKAEVVYFLLSTISIASSAIWGVIKNWCFASLPYYPFDMMLGMIFFSVFWFKRFFLTMEESRELAAKLQKEVKRKDDFLANTSHELRNPLHGIMNISQTIYDSERENLTEENRENLQVLMTVGRRMSMILNDILDMTKLKEDGIRLQIREVHLTSVVSGVFDMLHFMKEGKNITFNHTIPKTFPAVKADENRLFQILFNLIHNAVKYSIEGEIRVSAETKKEWAIIRVTDNGVGMYEDTLKNIFNPYEQADSGMTAIAGGIGLGLSICEQLVKLHGGNLSVEPSIGEGSTFTFTLPVGDNQASALVPQDFLQTPIEPIRSDRELSTHSDKEFPRLLVVDDDPLNLSIIERILLPEQYNVVTCTSGKDALVLLGRGNWDLVISDVMMPNMSGYQLTKKIRERFSISELPILLLTARSQLEDIQTGFYSGANDYVTKPVEKLELTRRVKALTDLKYSINERIRMEAAWLQAQIQPHFLFNTLNTIAALSEVDQPKMMELLDLFGSYLHASFAAQNLNQVVPLENEIELVRSYVFIEQERFCERLTIEWDFEEIPFVKIPPFSIQTIVENAIKHGVLQCPDGGTVRIQIMEHQDVVDITIADNGVGMEKEKLNGLFTNDTTGKRGIGLLNTEKRLKQLYGYGLTITSTPNVGTVVRFTIPKEN